ncbi:MULTISPECIES: deoxyhypusine synthase family protein [unclassified Moorena]|uniref:deoxyhypusine synthase family protein n=1 Tax=unclassified Moorena TaxID=2683338 RepID=UPI0025DC52E0|nr:MULTISPECIES: deoxyhypusine synthase family protein [unclassified Moorena]
MIREFMNRNFRHFNAAVCVEAAEGWVKHLESGNKMFLTMAGAMSTGELGISLAEMIRQDKVHAICCTGANLEEDIFNLVAHSQYNRTYAVKWISPP